MIVVGQDQLGRGVEQLGRGVEQESAEQVEDPVESFDQRHSGEDEDGSKGESTENSPEENPVLVIHRDLEVAQNQRPDEDVVDAE